jgi:hypothetical protein
MTKSLVTIAQECYEGFDPKLAELISIHHDDPEMPGEDTSFQRKLQMNAEQKAMHMQEELLAIDEICKYYPEKIEGYWYKEILLHSLYKDCREAQLHSYADKCDGYGEAMHELLAGNNVFLEPVLNYSSKTFECRWEKFPLIKGVFNYNGENNSPLLSFPVMDLMEFFSGGKRIASPHTPLTISLNTNIPFYEEWKRITIESFPDGMHLLTNQIEFVP